MSGKRTMKKQNLLCIALLATASLLAPTISQASSVRNYGPAVSIPLVSGPVGASITIGTPGYAYREGYRDDYRYRPRHVHRHAPPRYYYAPPPRYYAPPPPPRWHGRPIPHHYGHGGHGGPHHYRR